MKRSKTKALGQHFLRDKFVLRKIIRVIAPDKDDFIIEIGAGKGVLTFPLAKAAGRMIAIERDKSLVPELEARSPLNLKILEADVLTLRLTDLVGSENITKGNVKLVGNLPYVISSQILIKVLDEKDILDKCVFLLQKEVAERIGAQPGTKAYAPLSIRFENNFNVKLCFVVKPESFSPPPKVKSALISLEKRSQPLFPISDNKTFNEFLKLAFRHRRKTLLNNLLLAGHTRPQLESTSQELGMHKNVRPEQLTLSEYVKLFNFLKENGIIKGREP
ncbi:16S rRNA (adenine(1518)-N(6)/adenine(1519)-N(6))-dimethyltransferase RsmA [Acidobacteriota bacterium]